MTDHAMNPAANPPTQTLTAADGARAVIHAHGAHLTSWIPVGGPERMFLSRTADYGAKAAIRGGVPVIFPQFAAEGPLLKHGFARTAEWRAGETRVAEDGSAHAVWHLRDDEATRALWPQAFAAELQVRVQGSALAVTIEVLNTGSGAFSFTAALHTYLAVEDIAGVRVHGLQGLRYRDTSGGGRECVEESAALAIDGEVDRIYFDAPSELRLQEPTRSLRVQATGFPDVVVWNPGAAKGAALADLEPDGYRRFLCIEAAVIGRPVQLAPGARWRGTQTLIA